MRADNSHHLTAAAQRRAEQTRQRALAALRRMDATGRPVTFESVAREADVSRSWLYSQPDLKTQIEQLRQRHPTSTATPVPPRRQQASDASLLRRLEATTARIRALEDDNQQLREALARALGEQRAAAILGTGDSRDMPKRTTTKLIGPC